MNNKRKTLQKIAGFSAIATLVPSSWFKPVISSVVLPVHAQTSCSLSEASIVGRWHVVYNSTREKVWEIPEADSVYVNSGGSLTSRRRVVISSGGRSANESFLLFKTGEGIAAQILIPYHAYGDVTKVSGCLATEFILPEGNRQLGDVYIVGTRI